jgi:DNA repair protein RecN (Recombination protein N)
MLRALYIHNYAIIDEISIEFSPHLNAITGETGAGKSILMGALSLILGERADTSVLHNREKKCIVEGTFTIDQPTLKNLLKEYDLDDENTNELVIRREIAANGKSRAFVNDTPVNLEQLREVSSLLVDLHRQFDTLSLSDASFQRNVLDALADNAVLLQQYQSIYKNWRSTETELNMLHAEKNSFTKEYDYNKFLFDELAEANFSENELEDADNELKILNNAEGIKNALSQVSESLTGGEQPIVQQVKIMQNQLSGFSQFHPAMEELLNRLQSAQIELKDIADEVGKLNDEVGFNPARIEELNERLSAGYKLMKKHGAQTTVQLLEIQRRLEEKLQAVLNIDDRIAEKEKLLDKLQKEANEISQKLSERRKKELKPLEDSVNRLLVNVGMPNARLKVTIEKSSPDPYGSDAVEFLFDANKSNRFEPVRKVAGSVEYRRQGC